VWLHCAAFSAASVTDITSHRPQRTDRKCLPNRPHCTTVPWKTDTKLICTISTAAASQAAAAAHLTASPFCACYAVLCWQLFTDVSGHPARPIPEQRRLISRFLAEHMVWFMFCLPCIIVHQHTATNVMHFSFNILRIKSLYMYRALLAHPQMLHKRHLVYCVRVMSVDCTFNLLSIKGHYIFRA
jgi:hypothetical protein